MAMDSASNLARSLSLLCTVAYAGTNMTNSELKEAIDKLVGTMISVATGGPRIDEVNQQFQVLYDEVDSELRSRSIENSFPYRDLWQWYGYWGANLGTWGSRRTYVSELAAPVYTALKKVGAGLVEPTGWFRVDRGISEAKNRLASAGNEEQFQAVGLLCREILISVAQEVYEPVRHPILDGVATSETDFKRRIEAYIAVELGGSSSELARKLARSALDLALRLQHQRTAVFRDAAICLEATASVTNIIAIVSGRRDSPQ